jgi:hypothetical protein
VRVSAELNGSASLPGAFVRMVKRRLKKGKVRAIIVPKKIYESLSYGIDLDRQTTGSG